jgi:membrane-bound lytic murein transglycosylase D
MAPQQQEEFVRREAQRIARMMSNREYVFTPNALRIIKARVDENAREAETERVCERGARWAPLISREFRKLGVPEVLGLYMAWIESKYVPDVRSKAGAVGMFQFMATTAKQYKLDPADRSDPEKLAPKAALYFADRILEFGSDGLSVPLAIAAYNHGEGGMSRDLKRVLTGQEDKERSFWIFVEKSDRGARKLNDETAAYVPLFFGAAIVGENPESFGLKTRPLSTYVDDSELPSSR